MTKLIKFNLTVEGKRN